MVFILVITVQNNSQTTGYLSHKKTYLTDSRILFPDIRETQS